MWTYNTDYSKWYANDDSISKNDFDYLQNILKENTTCFFFKLSNLSGTYKAFLTKTISKLFLYHSNFSGLNKLSNQ